MNNAAASRMKTLAIEFSTHWRSIAAAEGTEVRATTEVSETRETPALGMVQRVLDGAGWERGAVERLVIGLGPGSYTGIRGALSLAQGWKLARPVELVGISSAAVLAEEARRSGWLGEVNIAIDAQRGEYYLAVYRVQAGGWEETEPLRIVSGEVIREKIATGHTVAGPGLAERFPGARQLVPSATSLALLAEKPAVHQATFEPIYLREVAFVKAPLPRVIPAV